MFSSLAGIFIHRLVNEYIYEIIDCPIILPKAPPGVQNVDVCL